MTKPTARRYPELELDTIEELPPSPLITVAETARLADLARMFVEREWSVVGVVDHDEQLVGMIGRTDLLSLLHVADATAVDAMSGVVPIEADSTIECAAALMVLEGVGYLVVVSPTGEHVGVITTLDIARKIAARAGYLAA